MRKAFFILIIISTQLFYVAHAQDSSIVFSITGKEALQHAQFLASNELRGRHTFDSGLVRAAEYIAGEFKKYGLQSLSGNEKYFQIIEMDYAEVKSSNHFMVNGKHYMENEDFTVAAVGSNQIKSEIVFVGYGISAPEYDSYSNVDVTDKIVMVFEGKIQKKGKLWGLAPLHEMRVLYAINHGATGMIFVRGTSPKNHKRPIPSAWTIEGIRQLSSQAQQLDLGTWNDEMWDKWHRFPLIYITLDVANELLAESEKTIIECKQEIDKKRTPCSFLLGKSAMIRTHVSHGPRGSMNVIGMVNGSDPSKNDEAIIIGAHFDHIGMTEDSSEIYHGADDNASGTAALLEIAQAFSECAEKPKRSVLFIAFTGEEMGCLGSRYFIEHPVIPISYIVSMFNLDMIGRNEPDEIQILCLNDDRKLEKTTHEISKNVGIHMRMLDPDYAMSSDHGVFYEQGIPIVFFYDGGGDFAHKPTDTWDKLSSIKMEKVARLCFLTAYKFADQQ
jgi:hypothetical protein